MKEKYGLSTQRVVYLYMPSEKQMVRLIVKASALSGDKNPNKEFGLFEYIDDLNSTEALMHEYITTATGVHRADPKGNKRKDYVAMTFKVGRVLTDTEKTKVESLIQEVHEKTTGAKESIKDASDHATEALDAVVDGSDPDLITFE